MVCNFLSPSLFIQVLSDDDKRQRYDLTGEMEDTPTRHSHSSRGGFTVFQSGGGGGGFQFHFQFPGRGGHARRDDSINSGVFFDRVLPESHHKPYLMYFYHDFCFECMRVESVWNSLKEVSVKLPSTLDIPDSYALSGIKSLRSHSYCASTQLIGSMFVFS